MKFTLRQIEVFLAVAQNPRFTDAAHSLHLSQPTVSADLRSLERLLGVELIRRGRAGNSLTRAGEIALPLAQRLLDDAAAFERALSDQSQAIRLAATPSMLNGLVPMLLTRLETSAPAVTVDVVEVATGAGEDLLAAGSVDAVLGHFLQPVRGARRLRLGDDSVYAVSAREAFGEKTSVRLAELAEIRLLLWPRERNPQYFDALMSICRERGLDPEVERTHASIVGAQSYHLREGSSFSLISEDFARDLPRSLVAVPLDPPATIPVQILVRSTSNEAVRAIVAGLRSLVNERDRVE